MIPLFDKAAFVAIIAAVFTVAAPTLGSRRGYNGGYEVAGQGSNQQGMIYPDGSYYAPNYYGDSGVGQVIYDDYTYFDQNQYAQVGNLHRQHMAAAARSRGASQQQLPPSRGAVPQLTQAGHDSPRATQGRCQEQRPPSLGQGMPQHQGQGSPGRATPADGSAGRGQNTPPLSRQASNLGGTGRGLGHSVSMGRPPQQGTQQLPRTMSDIPQGGVGSSLNGGAGAAGLPQGAPSTTDPRRMEPELDSEEDDEFDDEDDFDEEDFDDEFLDELDEEEDLNHPPPTRVAPPQASGQKRP